MEVQQSGGKPFGVSKIGFFPQRGYVMPTRMDGITKGSAKTLECEVNLQDILGKRITRRVYRVHCGSTILAAVKQMDHKVEFLSILSFSGTLEDGVVEGKWDHRTNKGMIADLDNAKTGAITDMPY
ncbi:hypothetical protein HKD37_13G036053 [Glycine soja]